MIFLQGLKTREIFEPQFEEEVQEVPIRSTAPQFDDDELEDERMQEERVEIENEKIVNDDANDHYSENIYHSRGCSDDKNKEDGSTDNFDEGNAH